MLKYVVSVDIQCFSVSTRDYFLSKSAGIHFVVCRPLYPFIWFPDLLVLRLFIYNGLSNMQHQKGGIVVLFLIIGIMYILFNV